MFDYMLQQLAYKVEAITWNDLEDHYYKLMEDNNLEDQDVYNMTKKQVISLVATY